VFRQQFYDSANADLFVVVESLEPTSEFVGALNLPSHASLCHRTHNASRVILTSMLRSASVKSVGRKQEVTRGTANLFADLGFPDASERQARLRLAYALNKVLQERDRSAAGTAKVLGITRANVSTLRSYKLSVLSKIPRRSERVYSTMANQDDRSAVNGALENARDFGARKRVLDEAALNRAQLCIAILLNLRSDDEREMTERYLEGMAFIAKTDVQISFELQGAAAAPAKARLRLSCVEMLPLINNW
jgi:predicted XRE-type DNA-binding protein